MRFLFDGHVLDIDQRELRRGTEPIALEPLVFDLLVFLVSNRGSVVSKDTLLDRVWSGRIVSESALASRIAAVRRAIGDSGESQKLIRTVSRKGFRFVGDFALHGEHILHPTVITLSPDMIAPRNIDQPGVDPDLSTIPPCAAFQYVAHAKFARDAFNVDGARLVGEA